MDKFHVYTDASTGEVTQVLFTPEEETAANAAAAQAKLSQVVSMRQARLALLQAGLLTSVEEAVAAGDEAGKITWEYATEVRRDDPLVTKLSAALGLTEQQLDDLFTLAYSL